MSDDLTAQQIMVNSILEDRDATDQELAFASDVAAASLSRRGYAMSPVVEPLAVTSEDLIALYELVNEVRQEVRDFAELHHTHGAWGCDNALGSALYYLWGAMGYLARSEGRLGTDKAEPGFHKQLPVEGGA